MLSAEVNETLTRVGPGTPAGELFRRYWIPVGISAEVKTAPKRVRYLFEDLVLYRNEHGKPGLLGLRCPHRLSSLEYARIESGGIRCIYHGWLYDLDGTCLEQPGEPADSTFKDRIRHTAYPCRDYGGLVFAYMGPGEPPLLPPFEILAREDAIRRASMDWPIHPCNFFQIVENDQDPWHVSILHSDRSFSQNRLVPNVIRHVEYDEIEFGVRYAAFRDGPDPGSVYVRRVNSLLPGIIGFGAGGSPGEEINFGGSLRWRVPVDDDHTAFFSVYAMGSSEASGGTGNLMDSGGIFAPRDIIERSEAGDYWEPDRDAEGRVVLDETWKQDYAAIVSQGEVADRNLERLGATDRGVTLLRKMYLDAIKDVQEGRDPKGVIRDPDRNELFKLARANTIGKEGEQIPPEYPAW